jgi:GNAT superfamily N-acetyltransferase
MIEEFPIENRIDLLPHFVKHKYLRLLFEGLLREGIGVAYVNNIENPKVVLIGKQMVYFIAGDPKDSAVPELLKQIPPQRLIFAPTKEWVNKMKEFWGEKLHPYHRTKFSSKQLDIKHMQEILRKLPDKLTIEKLTNKTIDKISTQAKTIINLLFHSLDDFLERNFGFCILDRDKIASLALAASPMYDKHFEIHIETDPGYQRRGLALIICAKIIEYSLQNNLVPHWDADNEPSAKLAIKLGFTEPEKYKAYFWVEPKE